MNIDLISGILLVGGVQGGFLSLVLLTTRRGNRPANRLLGCALSLFSAAIVLHALPDTRYAYGLSFHFELIATLFLLINPLLFLYVRALTGRPFQARISDLVHGVPGLLGVGGLLFLMSQSATTEPSAGHRFEALYGSVMIGQTGFYVWLMVQRLQAHGKTVRESFSSLDRVNLRWLRSLIVAYVSTWVVGFALEAVPGVDHPWDYVSVLTSCFMYAIGYFGLRQPEIFIGTAELNGGETQRAGGKYERSTLTDHRAEEYRARLLKLMSEEKPFLDSDLTLRALATRLSVSPHHLSQVINQRLGRSFFDFVNAYRIEEARIMLADPSRQHLNISTVGLDAGFNSISSFNSAFKKHAGVTPSQFRKSALKEDKTSKD